MLMDSLPPRDACNLLPSRTRYSIGTGVLKVWRQVRALWED